VLCQEVWSAANVPVTGSPEVVTVTWASLPSGELTVMPFDGSAPFAPLPGVIVTAVGYQGGVTPNPTYEETCTGRTGHTEAVMVVYDPKQISYADLLKVFWENHDPTQGMRQGNDVGTQYRSAIYTTTDEQLTEAERSREAFAPVVAKAGLGEITTEIAKAGPFYYAEDYHQQYLSDAKNPYGYCNHGPNGLSCPIGVAKTD